MTQPKIIPLILTVFVALSPALVAAAETDGHTGITTESTVPNRTGNVLESSNNVPKTGLEVEGAVKAGTRDPVLTTADRLSLEGMNFRGSDLDGDGRLSTGEFAKAGLSTSVFGSVDANHDGFVTHDELRAAGKSQVDNR